MLAVLGMLNSVINWRATDQDAGMARVATELSQLVVAGLMKPLVKPLAKSLAKSLARPAPARKRI